MLGLDVLGSRSLDAHVVHEAGFHCEVRSSSHGKQSTYSADNRGRIFFSRLETGRHYALSFFIEGVLDRNEAQFTVFVKVQVSELLKAQFNLFCQLPVGLDQEGKQF
jgi:hypothetical protein